MDACWPLLTWWAIWPTALSAVLDFVAFAVILSPADLAKRSPQMAFTSLAYLLDVDWLKEAYQRTRKRGRSVWTRRNTRRTWRATFSDCSTA